ncbi:MAG: hypothetical protein JWQ40_5090 [Segetibacter sp.]|nr:hypothetical protein [Segetibacter sp.]
MVFISVEVRAQVVESKRGVKEDTQATFDTFILKAASALSKNEFEQAKNFYKEASIIKPADPYPISMVKYVESSRAVFLQKQAKDLDLRRKAEINTLLNEALKAIMEKKYDTAYILYSKVLNLNPVKSQEVFIAQKMKAINAILAESKKEVPEDRSSLENQVAQELSGTGKVGSPSVLNKMSDTTAPSVAKIAKMEEPPRKTLPQQRDTVKIAHPSPAATDSLMKTRQNQTTFPDNSVASLKTPADVLMNDAIKAIMDKNYEAAFILYKMIISSNASKAQKEFAEKKIADIDSHLKKANNTLSVDTISSTQKKTVLKSEVSKEDEKTEELLAPTVGVIKKKTPSTSNNQSSNITPTTLEMPPTQIVDDKIVNTSKNKDNQYSLEFSQKLLMEAAKLNLLDSNNGIKLVCTNIAVINNKAYLKFLIENKSKEDFNPDTVEISYIKNYGVLQKLKGQYVAGHQAIPQKKDVTFVYVADAPPGVQPDEVFIVEVEDQLKKTKLILNIAGSYYLNKE